MPTRPEVRAAGSLLLPALLLLASCSFDYETAVQASGAEEPTLVFTGFVHRVVEDGALLLEISADRAEAYEEGPRTELRGVSFSQYASDGSLEASGRADAATVWTETENAEFRGQVLLSSVREDSVLEAESLTWVAETKTLSGGLERVVSVRREDGAWVSGAGFKADLARRSFSFQEATSGKIVVDEAPAAEPAPEPDPAVKPAP